MPDPVSLLVSSWLLLVPLGCSVLAFAAMVSIERTDAARFDAVYGNQTLWIIAVGLAVFVPVLVVLPVGYFLAMRPRLRRSGPAAH